jgi:hypothetical protein
MRLFLSFTFLISFLIIFRYSITAAVFTETSSVLVGVESSSRAIKEVHAYQSGVGYRTP